MAKRVVNLFKRIGKAYIRSREEYYAPFIKYNVPIYM